MSSEIVPPAKGLLEATYNALIGLWMQNLAINLPRVRSGSKITDLPKKEGEPCILLAAGPSIQRYKHLQMIQESGWQHPVLCCDKTLNDSLAHKIVPYLVASVDGSPMVADFYRKKLVIQYRKRINAAFSTTVHPNTVKAWKGNIYWFSALLDDPREFENQKRSISYILYLLSNGKPLISAVGNVGSFLWNLAAELGCSPIILVGYDFAEYVKDKADAIYFMQLATMLHQKEGLEWGAAQDKAALLHQVEHNPDFDTNYLVNPIWKDYRQSLAAHIITSKIHTINATGNGCLHTQAIQVPNFEAQKLEYVLKKYN